MVLGCLKVALVSWRNSPPVFKIRHATYEVDLALVATLPFSMRWFWGVSPQRGRRLQVGAGGGIYTAFCEEGDCHNKVWGRVVTFKLFPKCSMYGFLTYIREHLGLSISICVGKQIEPSKCHDELLVYYKRSQGRFWFKGLAVTSSIRIPQKHKQYAPESDGVWETIFLSFWDTAYFAEGLCS